METNSQRLRRFYFEVADYSCYVYDYDVHSAIETFKDNSPSIKGFVVNDEGEIDFPTIDEFYDKYNPYVIEGNDSHLHDKHDYWQIALKLNNEKPGTVWSYYDCGEVVCGMHTIDVLGFYFTEEPGSEGEIYGYYAGMID